MRLYPLLLTLGTGLVIALSLHGADAPPTQDFKDVDLEKYGIPAVPPKKDAKTGFTVGGKNPTNLLLKLTEINGRTIAELEKEMRPGVSSGAGFLGKDESLLEVLAADNRYVVEELGLTHQELARHLHALAALGAKFKDQPILYHGQRFRVEVESFRGTQPSPFHDGTKTNSEALVKNLTTGKEIRYSLLVPFMIERYGFYEGKGTRFRVDPRKIVEVFDFLTKK